MTLYYGANIVTSGLVMLLDAANPKSYSGSGTTVTDISRNGNNGTLIGSPTYTSGAGGYFSFSTSSYIQYTNASLIPTTDFAIDTWVYYTATNQTNISNIGNESTGRIVFYTSSNSIFYNIYGSSAVTMATGFVYSVWNHIVITRINGIIIAYLNGVPGTALTLSGTLGNVNGTNFGLNTGNVSVYRYYQGAGLTYSQILQNFNAHRGRYGI